MPIMTKSKDRDHSRPQADIRIRELGKIVEIPCSLISPNPDQPRKSFDRDELIQLAKSISQDGIVQPLTVRPCENGYTLVSGERRLRAAKIAGFQSVPCISVDISNERSAVVALIENIQRADLNFFEAAQAISSLITTYGMTQEEAAVRLGLSQPCIANKLRILRLTDEERKIITDGALSERHARAVLKITDPAQRKDILTKAAAESLTVAQTERLVAAAEREEHIRRSYKKRAPVLKDVRLFFNTVDKALDVIRMAGVNATVKKEHKKDYIEYTIRIPETNSEQ